jgi:Tol biopolymer transport system component/DNA-binding winged helix-turn-helix (wHTH) protein
MKNGPRYFYDFGHFRVDAEERILLREGKPVPLAPKAFDMLLTLVENSGHVMEKDQLLRRVWRDAFVEEANLSNNVFLLRKALGDDNGIRKYIETVPRRGYRFVADVRVETYDNAEHVLEEHTRAHIVVEEEHDEAASGFVEIVPLAAPSTIARGEQAVRDSRQGLMSRFTVASLVLVSVIVAGVFWFRMTGTKSRTELLTSPTNFSAVRLIPLTTSTQDEFDPALSPDGKLLAFSSNEGPGGSFNIYVKQIDAGSAPVKLTAEPVRDPGVNAPGIRDGAPAWSPDGRYIAYVRGSQIKDESGVFLIPALGGVARRLHSLKDMNFCAGLDWSPDGKSILIPLNTTLNDPCGLYLISLDTSDLKQLTRPPMGYQGDGRPAFSPDGRNVAFNRYSDNYTSELYITPSAGGEAKRLTFDKTETIGAAWTADSSQIVFASKRAGSFGLWKVSASGGTVEPLKVGAENALDPSIAIHGNRLAYTHKQGDTNIWRMDLHSPGHVTSTRLISSTRLDHNPGLSPNGKRIVFESDRSGTRELWLCDVDGSNELQLTALNGVGTPTNPRWSPDGTRIVFESSPTGLADTYTVSADGGKPTRLTDDSHNEVVPNWSADGRFVYFASDRTGDWQVWKIPSQGGEAIQVTAKGGFEAHESPDGRFLYYNRYGYQTRGLFRIPATGGEEELVLDIAQRESVGSWSITNKGVYFIDRDNFSHCEIKYFDFAKRRTIQLASLEQNPSINPGLNVSADERWFIFSLREQYSHDIMLLENFQSAGR